MKKLAKTENQKTKKAIFQNGELVGMLEDLDNPEIVKVDNFNFDKDGTRYGMTVISFVGNYGNNAVGYIKDGILVIAGHGKAYLFNHGYLSWDYAYEKLCPNWSRTDAKNIVLALEAKGYVNLHSNNSEIRELK